MPYRKAAPMTNGQRVVLLQLMDDLGWSDDQLARRISGWTIRTSADELSMNEAGRVINEMSRILRQERQGCKVGA